jgi:D-alanine-D-alanine ligase
VTIGLTFDLQADYLARGYTEEETAEFDAVETIAGIAGALESLGHTVVQIGSVTSLVQRLAAGERWDVVFNYAEGMFGLGREAQVPALLDAYQIPYTFSDTVVMALALHKGLTKRIARDLGVRTPPFAVVERAADVDAVDLPFPLFVKPLAGGTSVGVSAASHVTSRVELACACETLLRRFRQPVIVEQYLPGRELTVGIVGTGRDARAVGVLEVLFLDRAEAYGYSYLNKKDWVGRVDFSLPDDAVAADAATVALEVYRGLGCRDAARVDCRCDADGRVNFVEINPIAGLAPYSDLVILAERKGVSHRRLVEQILTSAVARLT